MAYRPEMYSVGALADLLGLVAANARTRWPAATYLLTSDVAWQLPGSAPEENIRLWYDDEGLAGYAWFQLTTPATFDIRAGLGYGHPIAAEALDWLEGRRLEFGPRVPWLLPLRSMAEWEAALERGAAREEGHERVVQVDAFDGDADRARWLTAHGYEATEHFGYWMSRSLATPIPAPGLANGWAIRHVRPEDFDARVAVHRDAWFRSGFTLAAYLDVRSIGVFDPELDLVAVSPDGEFASYCIGWVDQATGVGSFEPVGTPPKWRRRGIAREVQYEGLRRMRAKGMQNAKIGTAGFNDPAFGLYSSCGFRDTDRQRTYVKAV